MKIFVEKSSVGTTVKLYVPNSEVTSAMAYLSSDSGKDIRRQKTYKTKLSKSQRELLERILLELLTDFAVYKKLDHEDSKSGSSFNYVRSNLYKNLKSSLDDYQMNTATFNPVCELAKSFIFDITHNDEIKTIKDKYDLDTISDLLVSFIGTFRYGKTTLIKKILQFTEDFIFPLVDNSRTSISNCYFRVMIVKDGQINGQAFEDYTFKNVIELYDLKEFYNKTLLPNLVNAFEMYAKLRFENVENEEEVRRKTLQQFIALDTAELNELFGDINDYVEHNKSNVFYNDLFILLESIYQSIPDESIEQIDDTNIFIPIEYREGITSNEGFRNKTVQYLEDKIHLVIAEINEATYSALDYQVKNRKICFNLKYDQIGSLDDYYNYFVSNKTDFRGKLLRLLVAEIYTEIDAPAEVFGPIEGVEDFTSIVFTDTVGAGHRSDKTNKKSESSVDITNNLPLLNESDLIVLLDDASQSMKDTTEDQIKALEHYGLKNKVILAYSWYDHFLKNDMQNDKEREEKLLKRLELKLAECFVERPSVATRLYDALIKDNLSRIVFLKGLVPYVATDDSRTTRKARGRINNSKVSNTNSEADLARRLNASEEFEPNQCLHVLLNKMMAWRMHLKALNDSSWTLTTNVDDLVVSFGFASMHNDFLNEYIANQRVEYIEDVPSHKTTEALCYRLMLGNKGYWEGVRPLSPYNDALNGLMKKISQFFESNLIIQIHHDEEGKKKDHALNKDFLTDRIKNEFSTKISAHFLTCLIQANQKYWRECYQDGYDGVKYRRARNIYNIITETMNNSVEMGQRAFELFKESVQGVVDTYARN